MRALSEYLAFPLFSVGAVLIPTLIFVLARAWLARLGRAHPSGTAFLSASIIGVAIIAARIDRGHAALLLRRPIAVVVLIAGLLVPLAVASIAAHAAARRHWTLASIVGSAVATSVSPLFLLAFFYVACAIGSGCV